MQAIGGISASIPVQPQSVKENAVENEEGQDKVKPIGHNGESDSDEPKENVQPDPDKGNNISKFV